MTIDYPALTKGCKTQNQFNRVHINLENVMTPSEFSALAADAQAGLLPDQATKWLDGWIALCPTLVSSPEPYIREEVSPTLTWLRPARPSGSRPRVLIGFCGNADRLMLPLALVLQALPVAEWDVLRVTRSSFVQKERSDWSIQAWLSKLKVAVKGDSVAGKGSTARHYLRPGRERADLKALVRHVRRVVDGVPPADIVCLGTSSGSNAALLVARLLRAHRCVTIGGRMTGAFDKLWSRRIGFYPKKGLDLIHVCGADHPSDLVNAQQLMAKLGGRLVAFQGVATHSIFHSLLQMDRFMNMLDPLMRGHPLPIGIVQDVH